MRICARPSNRSVTKRATGKSRELFELRTSEVQGQARFPDWLKNEKGNGLKVHDSELARRVRSAFLRATLDAYEEAGIQGLCAEGRWECAVEAIRSLDLASFLPPDEVDPHAQETSQVEDA